MNVNTNADSSTPRVNPATPTAIHGAARRATTAIAPCWPLSDFVAVNPFLGLGERSFAEAADRLARVAGARLYMPRAFYAEAIAAGRISTADLLDAMALEPEAARVVGDLHALRLAMLRDEGGKGSTPLPTVSSAAASCGGDCWNDQVTEQISRWAARYFDQGQALAPSPFRDLSPYGAWRAEAIHDRTPEILGLTGFRRAVALLPESAEELIEEAVAELGLPEGALEPYFHRLLMTHSGWSAYGRYLDWQGELRGEHRGTVLELLAIRLAWELLLHNNLAFAGIRHAWRARVPALESASRERRGAFAVEVILQRAYELAWQKRLVGEFAAKKAPAATEAPRLQAAFCIDVRSEVYRRCLESTGNDIATIGFAGFFGIPMAYKKLGHVEARPHCPALLAPAFTLREAPDRATPSEERAVLRRHAVWRDSQSAWRAFKQGAVASFGFVETLGLLYAAKLVSDGLGITRPVAHPDGAGLPRSLRRRLAPRLQPEIHEGVANGLETPQRVELAARALTGMGLTERFARLVLFAGHGATTVNNPHSAGLDCGACGGHGGAPNVRVLVALLNDPQVRAGFRARDIHVPAETLFLGGHHDTTTDTVRILDADRVPATHAADLAWLEARLAQASAQARIERSFRLGLGEAEAPEQAMITRSRDWSQVRPEWGLAGCAAFVAAPRERTAGLDLGGRVFLHSYDWHRDEGFGVLEAVMTAPLVVASWINLQYYGSTVDNQVFGSGNKTLHNVVGSLGVLEGHGGDLRTGLAWQSVHDGERFAHEPLRLTAIIEAPVEAINAVIERHPNLRNLLDNGWMHLFALDARGMVRHHYAGHGTWKEVDAPGGLRVVAA